MRKFMGCVVMVSAMALGGCKAFLAFQPPDEEDIPAALTFVAGNEEMFTPSGNDPLADVAPGTVIDNLSEFDGCWGLSLPEPPTEFVELHQVYIFDRESGEYVFWVLQKSFFGSVTILLGDAGVFSVEGENLIARTTTTRFAYSPETRRLEESVATGVVSFEWGATLSGDWLKVRLDADHDEEEQREDNIVTYRRFDCPK